MSQLVAISFLPSYFDPVPWRTPVPAEPPLQPRFTCFDKRGNKRVKLETLDPFPRPSGSPRRLPSPVRLFYQSVASALVPLRTERCFALVVRDSLGPPSAVPNFTVFGN